MVITSLISTSTILWCSINWLVCCPRTQDLVYWIPRSLTIKTDSLWISKQYNFKRTMAITTRVQTAILVNDRSSYDDWKNKWWSMNDKNICWGIGSLNGTGEKWKHIFKPFINFNLKNFFFFWPFSCVGWQLSSALWRSTSGQPAGYMLLVVSKGQKHQFFT